MQNTKIQLIAAAVIILIVLALTGVIGYEIYIFKFKPLPANTNQPLAANTSPGVLPIVAESTSTAAQANSLETVEKEKKYISLFWKMPQLTITAKTPAYTLPLKNIKEQVANYRDFSRKIDLTADLAKLGTNGFVVVTNPLAAKSNNWQTVYGNIQKTPVPIFVTADSVSGIYLDTLNVVYREIEQEIFYQSLWQLLKEEFDKVSQRYAYASRNVGIETNLITEANRLELAYLSVGLKLLQPEGGQIQPSIAGSNKYFTSQEAQTYNFVVPPALATEVNNEIKLINSQTKSAKSPIFLYQKSYANYLVPDYYQTSEKLKNYYLAKTWLSDILFPLWNQSDSCPKCLLDQDDNAINFVAGLYLSSDLAGNQNLKNRWANIYKSIAFFRGTEANLTYLYYDLALHNMFGQDYDLDKIFTGNATSTKITIGKLREKINAFTFPQALVGTAEIKENKGLRLLRQQYLFESTLLQTLSGQAVKYADQTKKSEALPFTACNDQTGIYRCFPTGLDLFNFLGNAEAKKILASTGDSNYDVYSKNLTTFNQSFKNFDDVNWHENSYLSLLWSLKYLNPASAKGLPSFMQTAAWNKKTLNTELGAWVNFHHEINFEKVKDEQAAKTLNEFLYGYVEPQPEFYAQLLANTNMIIDGFKSLQLIITQSKSDDRLLNLKQLLEKLVAISQKELANTALSADDYNFINGFADQISGLTGDVKESDLQNNYSFTYQPKSNQTLTESINDLKYLIAVYPDHTGKLFFAIGPVYDYAETRNQGGAAWTWQKEYQP